MAHAAEVLHHFHGSYELSGLVEEIRERHGYLVELERLAAQQRDNGAWGVPRNLDRSLPGAGAFATAVHLSLLPGLEKTPTSYLGAEMSYTIGSPFRALGDRANTWLAGYVAV